MHDTKSHINHKNNDDDDDDDDDDDEDDDGDDDDDDDEEDNNNDNNFFHYSYKPQVCSEVHKMLLILRHMSHSNHTGCFNPYTHKLYKL